MQCAGIRQTVEFWDSYGHYITRTVSCGRYTTPEFQPACPAAPGRFSNAIGGDSLYCGVSYTVEVQTTLDLPVSGDTETSDYYDVSAVFC